MKYIKPFISRQKAEELFLKKKTIFFKKRKIEKTELIYLPYYLFKLTVKFPKEEKENFAVGDGIEGNFAYWDGENVEFSEKEKGSVFSFIISSNKAQEKIKDEYSNGLLFYNLKKKKNVQLKEIKEIDKFYYPYWVIYYRKKMSYNFSIIDAISGEAQGIRIKRIFLIGLNEKYKNKKRRRNK